MKLKKIAGFSLIAALITVVLLATVVIAFTKSADNIRRIAAQADVAAEEARDLKLLSDAVRLYAKTQASVWVADQRIEIDIPTLIASGFLPAEFASRFSAGVGISPLGQPYRIVTLVSGAADAPVPLKTPRTVITQQGPAPDLALERISIENSPEAILGVQKRAALSAVRDHKLSAGAIEQGASIVRGVNGAFTKDLTPWIGAADAPYAVSLVGFPDLDGVGSSVGPTGPRYTECQIFDGMAGCDHLGFGTNTYYDCIVTGNDFIQPSCPAPTVDVRRWSPTESFALIDTPIGTLTTGAETVMSATGEVFANCPPGLSPPANFATPPTASRYGVATINNVTALRQLLSKDVYVTQFGQSCPTFGTYTYYRGENVMCCNVVE